MHNESRAGVYKAEQTAYAAVRPAFARIGSSGPPVLETVAGNELDRALIAAIADGDEAAFNQIYARYYPRVARFTRRITGCSELTAEITNDTLWAIWRCASSFKGSSRVSTWIMGIAHHIGNKALRRSSRLEAQEETMLDLIE
jgi:hypothetical protein